jgi:hypothetical protein
MAFNGYVCGRPIAGPAWAWRRIFSDVPKIPGTSVFCVCGHIGQDAVFIRILGFVVRVFACMREKRETGLRLRKG